MLEGDKARNGYSFPIERLLLRKGGEWFGAGPMAPGAAAVLSPLSDLQVYNKDAAAAAQGLVSRLGKEKVLSGPESAYFSRNMLPWLSPGFLGRQEDDAYLLATDASPPGAWPGLTLDSEGKKHLVIGKMLSRAGEAATEGTGP